MATNDHTYYGLIQLIPQWLTEPGEVANAFALVDEDGDAFLDEDSDVLLYEEP